MTLSATRNLSNKCKHAGKWCIALSRLLGYTRHGCRLIACIPKLWSLKWFLCNSQTPRKGVCNANHKIKTVRPHQTLQSAAVKDWNYGLGVCDNAAWLAVIGG